MSTYYCLIAGLPQLSLDDAKLNFTLSDFKEEVLPALSATDRKLIALCFLKYDNANLLKLLQNPEADTDSRGNYTAEQLADLISRVKEGDKVKDAEFPSYLSAFLAEYYGASGADASDLENRLASLYYAYAMKCGNKFVSSWFDFNLTLNNLQLALSLRKYKMDVAQAVVGDTEVCEAIRASNARDFGLDGEIDYLDTLMKISETPELLERERRVDQLRWKWMEEATVFNYFTVERVFVFLLQIEMLERWLALDKEKGMQMFRSIIASLKDDVQIPAEFQ